MNTDDRRPCACGQWLLSSTDRTLEAQGKLHQLAVCGPLPPTVGVKHDAGKEPWDLLPWREVTDIVKVLQHGAIKYAPNNWKEVQNPFSRYLAAAMRHVTARLRGEVNDPESGLPHLAHAGCCLLFMAWVDKEHHAGS